MLSLVVNLLDKSVIRVLVQLDTTETIGFHARM